jgi:hypothetical protein
MKPRNRTIGPAHAIDEHVYELERVSGLPIRWAFAMLKLVADREGRFPSLPNQIKRAVLPYDVLDVNAVLSILERGGLVCRYEFAGRAYGCIPTFTVDQAVNPRESASILPPPSPLDIARWQSRASTTTGSVDASATREAREPVARNGEPLTRQARVSDAKGPDPNSNGGPEPPGSSSQNGNGASPHKITDLQEIPPELDASTTRGARVGLGQSASRSRAVFSSSVVGSSSSTEGKKEQTPESLLTSFVNSAPPESSSTALTTVPRRAVEVADGGSAQALPAIRGKRTADAIRERLAQVATEIATGARRRLLKDQRRKLGCEIVFGYWMELFNHPRTVFDEKREGTIARRLQENHDDVGELLYALDGARKDLPRNSDSGEIYDGIQTLLRDRGQVDRFAERIAAYKRGVPHPVMAQYADMFRQLSDVEIQENNGQVPLLTSGEP